MNEQVSFVFAKILSSVFWFWKHFLIGAIGMGRLIRINSYLEFIRSGTIKSNIEVGAFKSFG